MTERTVTVPLRCRIGTTDVDIGRVVFTATGAEPAAWI